MSEDHDALERALALGEEERWDEMAETLVEALRDDADDPYLLGWLGVAERERGNDGAAYEYFKRCVAQDPHDPMLLALAGSGLAAFDDPEAETALRAAIELDPEDPVNHGELATALALKGDVAGAIEPMEQAIEIAPDDTWNRALLGLLHAEADDMEHAAEHLLVAARERVDDPEVQVAAALAAVAAGWDDAGHEALARAGLGVEEAADRELIEEADDRIASGADTAREMLRETLGPLMLRERLMEPL